MAEDRSDESLERRLKELQQLFGQKDAQMLGLRAKIRGYETLGSVCQEKITECQRLESQVKELKTQMELLRTRTDNSGSQREHGASGSQVGIYSDAQCQTEDNYLSLSSIETQSLSLVSLSETDSQPTHSALTSQAVVLEFPPSGVSPRSVVETVAQVCRSMKNSVSDNHEDTPLSSQLDQLTIAVRKLEKQYFTQQTVVDGLNNENNRLKSASSEKEQQIVTLREENTSLREQLVRATDREHAVPADTEHAVPAAREHPVSADRENAEPASMQEWVKVEKISSQTEVVEKEPAPLAATGVTHETALFREIQELQAELGSFKIANDQWKEHSRHIEAEHNRLTTGQHEKLVEAHLQVQQLRTAQEQQQKGFDRLLMTANEKLLSEQQLRQECELKLTSVTQLVTRLQTQIEHTTHDTTDVEVQVTQLQEQVVEQQQIIRVLTDDRHNSLQHSLTSLQSSVSNNFMTPEALQTQVALLQQQVVVYKDDFNSERADRVRTQEAKDHVQSQLTRVSANLTECQSQLAQLQDDLAAARIEKMTLLRQKQEQEEVTCHMQQRVRDLEAQQSLQYVNVIQSEPPHPPHRSTVTPGSQWTCSRCTYSNIGARATCEMCGLDASSRLPLMVENMPALPMRFVARNVEQCDTVSDAVDDAVGDDTSTKQ